MRRVRDDEAPPESDAWDNVPHPRHASALYGHAAAERTLLDAYRAGRLPQSWILGGPEGVGKATLAWRFARFLFAHPDASAAAVQTAHTLDVDTDHPVATKLAGLALGDLFVLRREWNAKARPAKHFSDIRVDDVRAAAELFRLAASSGGWRVCIVDSADDLNRNSANALLKLIEEPPPRSLFLFVSQRPGQILPTIRSRSRLLMLHPLAVDDVTRTVLSLGSPWSDDLEAVSAASALSRGSVRRALRLLDAERRAFEQRVSRLLDGLPRVDWGQVHALGDSVARADGVEDYEALIGAVLEWLDGRVNATGAASSRLARYAEVWEKVAASVRETEALNLDKRPLVLSIFSDLAVAEQAARG